MQPELPQIIFLHPLNAREVHIGHHQIPIGQYFRLQLLFYILPSTQKTRTTSNQYQLQNWFSDQNVKKLIYLIVND